MAMLPTKRLIKYAFGYLRIAWILLHAKLSWIPAVIGASLAKRRGVRVRNEDRVRALVDVKTTGIVYYNGPFSTGFRCVIPRGSVLKVYSVGDLAFLCTPEGEVEAALVPASDRAHSKYAGAAFSINIGDIGRRFEVVSRPV
jgi:hypothetical protein